MSVSDKGHSGTIAFARTVLGRLREGVLMLPSTILLLTPRPRRCVQDWIKHLHMPALVKASLGW